MLTSRTTGCLRQRASPTRTPLRWVSPKSFLHANSFEVLETKGFPPNSGDEVETKGFPDKVLETKGFLHANSFDVPETKGFLPNSGDEVTKGFPDEVLETEGFLHANSFEVLEAKGFPPNSGDEVETKVELPTSIAAGSVIDSSSPCAAGTGDAAHVDVATSAFDMVFPRYFDTDSFGHCPEGVGKHSIMKYTRSDFSRLVQCHVESYTVHAQISLSASACNLGFMDGASAQEGQYIGCRGPFLVSSISVHERAPHVVKVLFERTIPMPSVLVKFRDAAEAELCINTFRSLSSDVRDDISAIPDVRRGRPAASDPNIVNKAATKKSGKKRR